MYHYFNGRKKNERITFKCSIFFRIDLHGILNPLKERLVTFFLFFTERLKETFRIKLYVSNSHGFLNCSSETQWIAASTPCLLSCLSVSKTLGENYNQPIPNDTTIVILLATELKPFVLTSIRTNNVSCLYKSI